MAGGSCNAVSSWLFAAEIPLQIQDLFKALVGLRIQRWIRQVKLRQNISFETKPLFEMAGRVLLID